MNAHHLDHPEGKHVHVHSIATQWVLAAQLILSVSLLPTSPLSAQTNATVHGHVFRIGLQTPIEDALIIAWPVVKQRQRTAQDVLKWSAPRTSIP